MNHEKTKLLKRTVISSLLFMFQMSFPLFPLCFRTESVAEKMLTNWFTFLLYKFLKVSPINIQHPNLSSFLLQSTSEVDLFCAMYLNVLLLPACFY